MPRQYDLYLSFSNDWILSLHLLLLIPTLYEPYYILNYRRHHSCKFHMSFIACRFSDSRPWLNLTTLQHGVGGGNEDLGGYTMTMRDIPSTHDTAQNRKTFMEKVLGKYTVL
jgi:hypothetical protein